MKPLITNNYYFKPHKSNLSKIINYVCSWEIWVYINFDFFNLCFIESVPQRENKGRCTEALKKHIGLNAESIMMMIKAVPSPGEPHGIQGKTACHLDSKCRDMDGSDVVISHGSDQEPVTHSFARLGFRFDWEVANALGLKIKSAYPYLCWLPSGGFNVSYKHGRSSR